MKRMSKICSKCKKENNDNARICGNCGIVLVGDNIEKPKEIIDEQVKEPEENTKVEETESEKDGEGYAMMLLFLFIATIGSFFIFPSATIILLFIYAIANVIGLITYPKNKSIKFLFAGLIMICLLFLVLIIVMVQTCTSCMTQIGFIIK